MGNCLRLDRRRRSSSRSMNRFFRPAPPAATPTPGMPETGVEPARPYGHKHLKLARLPIPPPGLLSRRQCILPAVPVNGRRCGSSTTSASGKRFRGARKKGRPLGTTLAFPSGHNEATGNSFKLSNRGGGGPKRPASHSPNSLTLNQDTSPTDKPVRLRTNPYTDRSRRSASRRCPSRRPPPSRYPERQRSRRGRPERSAASGRAA